MIKNRLVYAVIIGMFFYLGGSVASASEQIPPPKAKQTVLEKYVTAAEAYDMWSKNPETVAILDVRSPAEYFFVGHAPMAVNIPSVYFEWDAARGVMNETDNPQFESQVTKRFQKDQTILIMCRSGSRAAVAVNRLAEKGFKDVYNITDGFEGDKVKDKQSVYKGKRLRNGWKNATINWTYDLNPELVYKY